MSHASDIDLAEKLYREGLNYNWREGHLPENLMCARAAFTNAARLGHVKAGREVAEMIFFGSGGPKDMEEALLRMWNAYGKNDEEALDELVALLESYAESDLAPEKRIPC